MMTTDEIRKSEEATKVTKDRPFKPLFRGEQWEEIRGNVRKMFGEPFYAPAKTWLANEKCKANDLCKAEYNPNTKSWSPGCLSTCCY